MEIRYGHETKTGKQQTLTNAGMSMPPMNTQSAEKFYKESNVPKGRVFFIDIAHYERYDEPEITFFGFVFKWKEVKKRVWQRIFERENVGYY